MLADLKTVEDKLYKPEHLETFLKKHSVHDLIKQLNKATKKETRDRIRYCFSKIGQSPFYKDLLLSCLSQQADKKKQFLKYVSSQHSEEFFTLLQNKPQDVLEIIQNDKQMIPVLLNLISYEHGIKLVKLFNKLYQNTSKHQILLSNAIKEGLAKGLGFGQEQEVDSVSQMRYFEIVVNLGVKGGQSFKLVEPILDKSLLLYKTEDILLKMAMVQVIGELGRGQETSKLMREHSIWKLIEKDACDVNQEFYVKKFLLVLLVDMFNNGHYQMSPKVVKNIHEFLVENLKSKGQQLQAAVDIISHLFNSAQGIRIVVQNIEVLNRYVALSRSTQEGVKRPYYNSLLSLTHHGCETSKETKEHPKYKLAINVLNCIGNPNLTGQLNHNLHANNYLVYGINDFNKWFCSLLQLPFEQAEGQLLGVFDNILNFYQVIQSLLQIQDTTKYLLRAVSPNDSKNLKSQKSNLIARIIAKGKTDWQGLELSQYSRNLEKMMEGSKTEMMYASEAS